MSRRMLGAQENERLDAAILSYPCSTCGASEGAPCVTVSGSSPGASTGWHAYRLRNGYAAWLSGVDKRKAADLKSPPPATVVAAVGGDEPTTPPAGGRQDFHVEGCLRPMQYGCCACACGMRS